MALAYLLDPSFQTLNENGRPLVGGYIEVYYHNTSIKYVTKADFEGTDNPFKVPLNSKGMAVIIANDQYAYDVFCYDAFGALFWSRQNVGTIGGGGGIPVAVDVPLVRVKFQQGIVTKLEGDDGFVKENKFGDTAFFLPENVWYQLNFNMTLSNTEARDLAHQMYCEWEWATWIADDVPPAFYGAGMPEFYETLDCTTTWTKNFSASRLYKKDFHINDWLTYNLHLPANVPYTILLDVFKLRDE